MPSGRVQRRIDNLLDEADDAVVSLDWAVVRACAESVPAFDPENVAALEYVAAADRASKTPDHRSPQPTIGGRGGGPDGDSHLIRQWPLRGQEVAQ
jgi:hypothetical protein